MFSSRRFGEGSPPVKSLNEMAGEDVGELMRREGYTAACEKCKGDHLTLKGLAVFRALAWHVGPLEQVNTLTKVAEFKGANVTAQVVAVPRGDRDCKHEQN